MIIISYPTSASGIIVFIKNNEETLLYLAAFALQEHEPEDNLMVAFSRPWYNGSHTLAAKPIRALELQYPMITVWI